MGKIPETTLQTFTLTRGPLVPAAPYYKSTRKGRRLASAGDRDVFLTY